MRASVFFAILVVAAAGCSGGGGGSDSGVAGDPADNAACVPDCVGKQCGDDGCGGSCGACMYGAICNTFMGQCVGGCVPDCTGKQCGDDGCGNKCGVCQPGTVCNTKQFVCDADCQPDCAGKQCGDDGCEGTCGDCPAGTVCEAGQCTGGMSCQDGEKNGTETDLDCGGACPACGLGKACLQPADCLSKVCMGGFCAAAPTCDDYVKNGNESDVDCGGGDCAACVVGKACFLPSDCASGICQQGVCGAPASCKDGSKNGGETDVDCGGGSCPACALTKFCSVHADCLSLNCYYGVCSEPTCDDGSKNQDESDVDCGGKCKDCPDGKKCKVSGDCASGLCEAGTCISCDDGVTNGKETDTDCGGGQCPKCGLGDKCNAPSDCTSGACEGGSCCTPNACGECTATPDEVCDGKDNDCDGKTDEKPDIGSAPSCPKQAGVCAGSWAACKGAQGWVCDDGVYLVHDASWEAVETKCDGKDNDCDGQTDEGLMNPCGWCGPTPVEACNGLDDDCNGQTDELVACDTCVAEPVPVKLYEVSSSWGFQMSWKNWLAVLDDHAFILFYPRGNYTESHLVKCGDGKKKNDWTPSGLPTTGNNSIVSGGGKLHLGTAGYLCQSSICTHHAQYFRFDSSGTKEKFVDLGSASNVAGQPATIAWAQGTAWMGFWDPDEKEVLYKLNAEGDFGYVTTYDAGGDYGTQLVVDGQGKWHTAYIDSPFDDKDVYYQAQGGSPYMLCSNDACGSPALRIDGAGTLHVVYSAGGKVVYRKKSGSSWGSAHVVDSGGGANLAFDTAGRPVVSYLRNDKELWVAWVASMGAGVGWTMKKIYTEPDTDEYLSGTAVGVDGAGRIHLGLRSYTTSGAYSDYQYLYYLMACLQKDPSCVPDCAGKDCGSDGCGGLCGTCKTGETCVEGACEASAVCGPAGSSSCMGKCGGSAGGGCWCDSACTGNGDCCSDYQACCG